jgi:hypothetical protein
MHDFMTMTLPRPGCCKGARYYPGEWTPFSPFGAHALDDPYGQILRCFIAPVSVQRAARAQGVNGVIMQRVPGLAECLIASGLKR